ncbi:MAG: hypothetical protein GY698_24025 [Actinomycetia bacterium]|nr:hypothetical protein [Actinomycetes bacterium]
MGSATSRGHPRHRRAPAGGDDRRGGQDSGFTVVSAMVAMATTLLLVTWFANLFVHRYAQGVIRQATNQAAHAWAASGGTHTDCQTAANDVLGDLLNGPLGDTITITCTQTAGTVTVTATGTLTPVGPLPAVTINTTATASNELEDGLTTP